MQLLTGLSTILSLALLTVAGNHNVHLNRNHDALAKRVAGDIELQKRFSGSRWSWYDAQTGNAGACGRHIGNSEFAVALNTPQYGGGYPGPNCFKTITLTYNGKTAQAVILDQCPGCPWGGLDLTPALFAYFAPHSEGIIYGSWDFGGAAPAPTTTTTWRPAPTTTTTWRAPTTTTTWRAPTPTTTWQPPPTTTSVWKAPTSTWKAPTTSSSVHISSSVHSSSAQASSSVIHSASASAAGSSGSVRPTGAAATASFAGGVSSDSNVLREAGRVLLAFGNVVIQGAAASGN